MILDRLTLLASSPAGTTLVLRDRAGRLWLYPPVAAGQPRELDVEQAERVIAHGELERVERTFGSWAELDAFRQARAAAATPQEAVDVEKFDLQDVELMLGVARELLSEGESERARLLVLRLLRAPAAKSDRDAYEQLLDFLEGLERPSLSPAAQPPSSYQQKARERWELARAA